MKMSRLLTVLLASSLFLPSVHAQDSNLRSTAVFYADQPPLALLGQFQRVIVEADNLQTSELKRLHQQQAQVFAYLSVGEVSPTRRWYKQVERSWVLGRNNVWDSDVLDLSNPEWQKFLLDQLVDPLVKQGYDGLFLDTLDSFQLYATSAKAREQQAQALADLLRQIRKRYPKLKLIANRGFEVMPQIAPLLEAVVAESLFATWDNAKQAYLPVANENSEWLLDKLQAIQQEYGLEVVIIDYMPPAQRKVARQLAARIEKLGFVPWISTPGLDSVGVGLVEPALQDYLVVFDSQVDGQRPLEIPSYRKLQQRLQADGFQLELHDVQSGLPRKPLLGRYKAVINGLNATQQSAAYQHWLQQQRKDGVVIQPLAMEQAS